MFPTRVILAIAAALALAACARTGRTPAPAPRPSPTHRVAQHAVVSTGSAPKARPSATPVPPIGERRPPAAPPVIVDVQVNSTEVGSGDTLSGKVLTSSNVASVEVRVATYGVSLKKVGVGRFEMSYKLGYIPFFVRGTYPMRIIARNTRGDSVERSLPLTIH